MQFSVVGAVRIVAKQLFGTLTHLFVVTLRIINLHEVIGNGLGIGGFVLQLEQSRQRFVVLLHLVHAVRVVITSARSIAIIRLAELREIDRCPLILLLHQIGISAIERIVRLVGSRQCLRFHLLQDLQTLLIVAFLHLQYTLHEIHLVRKRGVRESDQVRLQIPLQQLIPPVETRSKSIVLLLHFTRLSKERSKE